MNFKELYEINSDGVIHQKKIIKLETYDINYIENRYNKYGFYNDEMSYLRLGFLLGTIKEKPNKILDIGYGNGSFLKISKNLIEQCYGYDISNYPLPNDIIQIDNIFEDSYDVICFFDVLEHLEDIEIIKKLKTKYIFISVPWCHFFSEKWFMEWKHRRFDEHLWHFNDRSLDNFMYRMNYKRISKQVNIEDSIRKTPYNYENILTCVYKKN